MKDDRLYLVDMIEIARRVQRRANSVTEEQFNQNEDLQLALAHLRQTIGEAARLVSPPTRATFPSIPWSKITGMRHKIVHHYLDIRSDIVWATCCFISELIDLLAPVVDPLIQSIKVKQEKHKP